MIPFLFPSTFWTALDLYMAKCTCNLGQRSPLLIVCGGGLRTFSGLQLFPVEVNSFCTRCLACALVKAFCSQPHPSLRGANGNPTCIYVFPLGFSLVWCLVPGAWCLVVATHRVVMVTLHTCLQLPQFSQAPFPQPSLLVMGLSNG